MALRSLRARVILGSLLWTAGLLGIAHVISIALVVRFPGIFLIAHGSMIAISAVLLMVAGLIQVRRGLSPFHQLRAKLAALREGGVRRVDGTYPAEVQPLVEDLNVLLAHHDDAVRRAVAKAGDLAHGLKTPLAVIAQEADRAAAAGHADFATAVGQQVTRMRRQMDYHLAQARAAASGATPGARCLVAESVDGLSRALGRLHAGRGLAIDVQVAASHAVRVHRADLDEMLGNLLDNACQWAETRVVVSSSIEAGAVVVIVDDDGPGLAPSMRDAVLQRGVRADEAVPGTGLGLAIVRDLAALYGGTIALSAAPTGGLRARLQLPAA